MSRFARKVDSNHTEIVRALEAIGVWVRSTASVGNGFPDLLVCFQGRFTLLELKRPGKKLNAVQKEFFGTCPGPCYRVESAAEAFAVLGIKVSPDGTVHRAP